MRKVTRTVLLAVMMCLLALTAAAEADALDLSGRSFGELAELTALMDQQEGVETVDLTGVPLTVAER
ncbi:MAG: hypothetical protein ACI4OY_13970, partial [Aristaeellaceae bacterium]